MLYQQDAQDRQSLYKRFPQNATLQGSVFLREADQRKALERSHERANERTQERAQVVQKLENNESVVNTDALRDVSAAMGMSQRESIIGDSISVGN